jgi:outer membrane protein assembly factor BamB
VPNITSQAYKQTTLAGVLGSAVLLAVGLLGCSSMQNSGILVPPERNVMPEYPAQSVQHRVLTVLWRTALMEPDAEPVERHFHGRSSVGGNGARIYVGSFDGTFYCFDAQTGKQIWRKLAEGPFDAQPLVKDGVVYASSGGGVLYAWRETDGEQLWTYRVAGALDSQPVISGDSLLLATDTNLLTCIDAMTGKWRWNYRREVPTGRFQVKGLSRPAVVGQDVFMGFSDGTLARLALADGSVKSVKRMANPADRFTDIDTEPLLVDDDLLLVGPFSRGVVALNLPDLTERWTHEAVGVSNLVLAGGMVYYTTADSKVEALRLKGLQPVWRFKVGKGALSQPVVAGNYLLVSSGEHSLLVIDRTDGKLLQVFNPGKGSGSAPTVAGDRVYWISNGQTLYCMALTL